MNKKRLIVKGRDVGPVLMATNAKSRSKGLLGRTGLAGAMWLAPARQVHTFRMKFTIDVAYLDKSSTVIHVATMPPGKLGKWSWRSRGVLEAEGGSFAAWGIACGDTVEFTSPVDAGVVEG